MKSHYFDKKKPNSKKLLNYGFNKKDDCYYYNQDIMQKDFNLSIEVFGTGEIDTKLIEKSTNEEYTLHLVKSANGQFIGKIREEYENILKDIGNKCFDTDVFKSKQAHDIIRYVSKKYNDSLEYLWEKFPENAVCRRKDNKKWYFAILTVAKNKFGFDNDEIAEVIDLRAKTEEIEDLIKTKKIYRGYHMNKKHWISIILDNSVDIEEIFKRIDISYELAKK